MRLSWTISYYMATNNHIIWVKGQEIEKRTEIVFEEKKSERNFDLGKKYIDKNDYEAYFAD